MTQRKITFLMTATAVIVVAESCLLWTGIVAGSVSLRIWSSIADVPSIVQREEGALQTIRETHHAAPLQPEPEVLLDVAVSEPAVVTHPSWRKGIPEALQENELLQWGIRSWLTISIPSLDVRSPVYFPSGRFWNTKRWELLEEQMQLGLLYGATAYPHSVQPGEGGTIFIAGHSSPPTQEARESAYGSLFAGLPTLQPGDTIVLAQNGRRIEYHVESSSIVTAQDTHILIQQGENNLLKLITCYPIGTTKDRLVVTAREV